MKYLILLLISFNILLASRWIMDGNLFFHTDIARDFLLMEDIVDNRHLTLIGPRSGAIPGLFHGPLWLYFNIPAFLIGNGDPIYVGWFWVLLYIFSLFITYYAGKKLFGEEEGLLSALLLSSATILQIRSLFNPYGALLLSPLYLYLFVSYLKTKSLKTLIIVLFLLGLIIQFQMAFGVPILFLTMIYLLYFFYKNKKLSHLISFFVLLIPLSSFYVFDLRNKFLQVKSVVSYFVGTQTHGKLESNLFQLVGMRIKESIFDGLGTITQNSFYLTLLLLVVFIFGIYLIYKKNNSKILTVYTTGIFFYLGFWFFTIFFKGPIWNYYYLPFIPLLILIFVSFRKYINSFLFFSIVFLIYAVNMYAAIQDLKTYNSDPRGQDVSTWKFNKLVSETIFAGSEESFGYFIFTPDLYGYSPRYAIDLYQKRFKDKKVKPYEKSAITYLVIAPPPYYGKDPNSIWYQKNTNSTTWKISDIRIISDPASSVIFNNGFIIEKYNLSDEEIKMGSNPYLIKDIFFR